MMIRIGGRDKRARMCVSSVKGFLIKSVMAVHGVCMCHSIMDEKVNNGDET